MSPDGQKNQTKMSFAFASELFGLYGYLKGKQINQNYTSDTYL